MSTGKDPLIQTEQILKHKDFRDYQPDLAKAILTKPAYTIAGAKQALDKGLKRKECR